MSELTLTFRPMAEMPNGCTRAILRGGHIRAHGFERGYTLMEAVRDPNGRWWAASGGDIEIVDPVEWATGVTARDPNVEAIIDSRRASNRRLDDMLPWDLPVGGTVSGHGGLMGEKPSERTSPPVQEPDKPGDDLGASGDSFDFEPIAEVYLDAWKRPTPYTDTIEATKRRLLEAHSNMVNDDDPEHLSIFSQARLVIESLQQRLRDAERSRDNTYAAYRDIQWIAEKRRLANKQLHDSLHDILRTRKGETREARIAGLWEAAGLLCDHCAACDPAAKDEDGWWHSYVTDLGEGLRTARRYECEAGPIVAAIEAIRKEG